MIAPSNTLPSTTLKKLKLTFWQDTARKGRVTPQRLLYWSFPFVVVSIATVITLAAQANTANNTTSYHVDETKFEVFLTAYLLLLNGLVPVMLLVFWLLFFFGMELGLEMVWRNFIDHLPHGTFMVSYAWGAEKSKEGARKLGSLFGRSVCWVDINELIPGKNIQNTCAAAAKNALVQFVFLSPRYLCSDNCKAELREILKHPEQAIVFVDHDDLYNNNNTQTTNDTTIEEHSDPSATVLQGDEEEAKWTIAYILEHYKFALVLDLATLVDAQGSNKRANTQSLGAWATKEFVLCSLLDCGLLRWVFQHTSPIVNASWLYSVAVVTNQPRVSWKLMLLFWVLLAVLLSADLYLGLAITTNSIPSFTIYPVGTLCIAGITLATFFTFTLFALDTRALGELHDLGDILQLLVLMRRLDLIDPVKVHAKLPSIASLSQDLVDLQATGVVQLVGDDDEITSDTVVLAEIDEVQNPGPQSSVYFCRQFSDVTLRQREIFDGHLIQETLIGSRGLQEVVGIAILEVALKGATIVPGDTPFEYHTLLRKLTRAKQIAQQQLRAVQPAQSVSLTLEPDQIEREMKKLTVKRSTTRHALTIASLLVALSLPLSLILAFVAVTTNRYALIDTEKLYQTEVVVVTGWDGNARAFDLDTTKFLSCVTANSASSVNLCDAYDFANNSIGVINSWDRSVEVHTVNNNSAFVLQGWSHNSTVFNVSRQEILTCLGPSTTFPTGFCASEFVGSERVLVGVESPQSHQDILLSTLELQHSSVVAVKGWNHQAESYSLASALAQLVCTGPANATANGQCSAT